MLTHMVTITMAALLSASAGQAEDQSDQRGGPGWQPSDAERQEWRARMERMRNAGPEERRRMRLDGMVDMAARTYELDDAQKIQVRNEIEAIDRERRAALGPMADEQDRLREQMGEYWRRQAQNAPREGGDPGEFWRNAREDPEFRKLTDRLREIEQQHPFDWRASIERVEKLLPEEQAAKGRERWQGMMQRFTERQDRGERGNRGDRRDRIGGNRERGRGFDRGDRDARRRMVERLRRQEGDADAGRNPLERAPRPAAKHPWETHVEQFIKKYELTPTQTGSANAILKDVLARASQIEQSNADALEQARKIEDPKARQARLDELNAPKEQLFEELKSRLDGLLTAAQRAKGK